VETVTYQWLSCVLTLHLRFKAMITVSLTPLYKLMEKTASKRRRIGENMTPPTLFHKIGKTQII
jgi:hypothetical protein